MKTQIEQRCPSRRRAGSAFRPACFADEGGEAAAAPGMLVNARVLAGQLLDGGEIVLLTLKPSMWFLVLVSVRWLLAAAIVIVVAPWLVSVYPAFSDRVLTVVTQSALVITAIRLIAALLQWSSRLFILTNRRVMSHRGVFQVSLFEAPLVQIRNTYVNVRRFEKWFNVGSIGFSLSGAKKVDAWWDQISDPHEVHDRVRGAIEKALDNHTPY